MNDVLAICDLGHRFVLKDFEPDDDVVAALSWCPEMVSKKDHGDLILECGARVQWRRHVVTEEPKRWFRFRSPQLDLFWDHEGT